MKPFLGIDAGTTSVSAALIDAESGGLLGTASRPHRAYLDTTGPAREQDLDAIFSAIETTVSELTGSFRGISEIAGIGVTGQMHGFVLLDERLDHLTPFVTWEDARALESAPDGGRWIDLFNRRFGALLESTPGVRAAPGFGSVQLFVKIITEGLPRETRWIVSIEDWLVSKLTGEAPVTDPSCAHSLGLFAPGSGVWHRELAVAIGIDPLLLPKVVPAGTLVGNTRDADNGIPAGIPVFAGLGDNQASFLAAVSDPAEQALITVGTGSQISVAVDSFRVVPGLDTRPLVDDRFLLVGAPLAGGRAIAMVYELVREAGERIFGVSIDESTLYAKLTEVADIDTRVECRTTFSGTRTDPNLLGRFDHVGPGDLTVGAIAGSVIVGVAAELAGMYRAMGVSRSRGVSTGNGVRRNPLLLESLRRALGFPVSLCRCDEEAATGAALAAGIGADVIPRHDSSPRAQLD